MSQENITVKEKSSTIEVVKLLVTIVGVISAIKFLNDIFSKSKADEEKELIDENAASARQKLYRKIPPSFPDYIYKDWADTLDFALLREGTEDEQMVYGVFEGIKNESDVQKIIDAFGYRRKMFTTYQISLPQAIAVFFSPSEKFKLNLILITKRINYRFK